MRVAATLRCAAPPPAAARVVRCGTVAAVAPTSRWLSGAGAAASASPRGVDFEGGDAGSTHVVANQAVELCDINLYTSDSALHRTVHAMGGAWAGDHLRGVGEVAGRRSTLELGCAANAHGPTLRTHDRFGNRINAVAFHPAYHDLMRMQLDAESPCFAWNRRDKPGAFVARSAIPYMWNQVVLHAAPLLRCGCVCVCVCLCVCLSLCMCMCWVHT